MGAFVFVLEMIGTVAFAASGALLAIRKKMDIFGVCMLALITSVGGGIIRDLLLGATPPSTFRNPIYAITAAVVSAIIFIRPVRYYLTGNHMAYQTGMLVMDSLGLAVFSVVGVSIAYTARPEAGTFLIVFVGVLSGVGGGVGYLCLRIVGRHIALRGIVETAWPGLRHADRCDYYYCDSSSICHI